MVYSQASFYEAFTEHPLYAKAYARELQRWLKLVLR